jgi:predicted membrane channel-forming protein YqfA (hemolysin III family)
MNEFFWTSGHLGWGIFALVVFTALWGLFSDLVWRSRNVRIGKLAVAMSIGWIVGVGVIFLGFYLCNR